MAISIFELFGEIELNSSKFEASLQEVDRKLQDAKNKFSAAARDIEGFGKKLIAQVQSIRAFENALAKQIQTLVNTGQANNTLTRTHEKQQQTLARLRSELTTVATAYNENDKVSKKMERQFSSVEKELGNFNNQLKNTQSQLKNASTAGHTLASSLKKLGSVGSEMRGLGASLTLGLTTPLVALGTIAVKAGMEYEVAMNIFQSATRATTTEMKQAEALATALGADLTLPAISAKDAANAMTQLAKSGLTARESLEAVRGTLQLAIAANISAAQAAEISSNALQMFGLEASQAGRVADLLAGAANRTSGEVTDIAYALRQAGGVAANAKVSIEDLVTAIGLMARRGIQGQDAGTSIKTMLLRLQSPTAAAAREMEKLGVSIFNSKQEMRPFREIVEQFEQALSKLSEAQKIQALDTIFGSDAIRAALTIFGAGVKSFDELKNAVTQTGAAQDMAAARTKGLSGAWEALKSQLETIGLIFYNKVKGPLTEIMGLLGEFAASIMAAFEQLPTPIQAAIGALVGVTAIAGPIIATIGVIAAAIAAVGAPVVGIVTAITVGFAFIVAALTAHATTIYQIWQQNFGGLRDFTQEVVKGVKIVWSDIVGYFTTGEGVQWIAEFKALWTDLKATLKPIVKEISEEMRKGLGGAIKWVKENYPLIKKTIRETLTAIKEVIFIVLSAIRTFWSQHGEQIKTVVSSVWGIITTIVRTGIKIYGQVIKLGLQIIIGDWSGAFATLINIVLVWLNGALSALKSFIPWLIQAGRNLGNAIINGITLGLWSNAGQVYNAISSLMFGTVGEARKALDSKSPSKKFYAIGQDAMQGYIDGVNSMRVAINEAIFNALKPPSLESIQLQKSDKGGVELLTNLYNEIARLNITTKEQEVVVNLTAGAYAKLNPQIREAIINAARVLDLQKAQKDGTQKLTEKLNELTRATEEEKTEQQKVNELLKSPSVLAALNSMTDAQRKLTIETLKFKAELIDIANLAERWKNIMESVQPPELPELPNIKSSEIAEENKLLLPETEEDRQADRIAHQRRLAREMLERTRAEFENFANNITDIFGQALDRLWEGDIRGFLSSIGQGFKKLFQQIVSDFLLSGLNNILRRLFGINASGGGGGILGAIFGGGGGGGGGFLRRILGIGGTAAATTGTAAAGSAAAAGGPAAGVGSTAAVGSAAAAGGAGFLGSLGAFFTNPLTAIVGASILAGVLFLRYFQNRTEKKLKSAISKEYGVLIKDMKVLKEIKSIGEAQFGKGQVSKKLLETIRLPRSKEIIRNYAETTGQSHAKLGPSIEQLQDENFSGNRFVARMFGGRVNAKTPYVVGEQRPELFVPDQSGRILPSVPSENNSQVITAYMAATEHLIGVIEALEKKISSMSATEIVTIAANHRPEIFQSAFLEAANKRGGEATLRKLGFG